eukprot:symbB.v1.2.037275.t1/scaffold5461.1/size26884/2
MAAIQVVELEALAASSAQGKLCGRAALQKNPKLAMPWLRLGIANLETMPWHWHWKDPRITSKPFSESVMKHCVKLQSRRQRSYG